MEKKTVLIAIVLVEKKTVLIAIVLAFAGSLTLPAYADYAGSVGQDKESVKEAFKKPGYSPYAGRNFPTKVLWGDTHLHTALSLDARAFGVILGPEEAYRF
ncbi:MAG: DUF3604 domain-containing protein, partial [Planctomycetota bacterium]